MAHKVNVCGLDTNKLPKLSAEESIACLQKIKEGDVAAREKFLLANMRLVLSMVHRFSNAQVDPDDLFQIGCLGLVKALDHFDLRFGVRFSTYAVPMILGEIRRFVRENSGIKVSRAMRDTAYQAMQAREALERRNVVDPSLYEIAEEMDVPVKEVVCALDAIAAPMSLYEPISGEGEDSLLVIDGISSERNPEEGWSERIDLRRAIDELSDQEKEILDLRYYRGRTQIEVSAELGISQAQVSRLENTAIKKLRTSLAD